MSETLTEVPAFQNETPPANNQDMFIRACDRLLGRFKDGRSKGATGGCLYRKLEVTAEDYKVVGCCVIGYVLPDFPDLTRESHNSDDIEQLRRELPEVDEWLEKVSLEMLMELQQIHDNGDNWESYVQMWSVLRQFAHDWDLVFPVIYSNPEGK